MVKSIAGLKEIAVAYRFGVNPEVDAYLIAFMYATFMVNILGGSFSSALVPNYVRLKTKQGFEPARNLLSNLTGRSFLILGITAFILSLFAKSLLPLVGSGFNLKTLSLTINLAFIMLPTLVFVGISITWGSVLNTHKSFKIPAFTPVFPSILIIFFVFCGPSSWGVYSLAFGTVLGFLMESVFLGIRLKNFNLSPIPRFRSDTNLTIVNAQFTPLMIGALMSTGMLVVDQSMAAMLSDGSVAALNYGYRIVAIVFNMSAAIWIVSFPKFSRMAAVNDWASMRKTLRLQLTGIMSITVPLVIMLVFLSKSIVRFLYQRGAFTSDNTNLVALVQSFYLLQAPFFICSALMMKMLSSLNENKVLMWGGALAMVLNIAFNFIFIRYFEVAGIALSTSIVIFISFGFLYYMLHLKLKTVEHNGRPITAVL